MSLSAQEWVYYGAMAPILLCSFVGAALVFERVAALRRGRNLPEQFLIEFDDLVARKAYNEAATLCRKTGAPLARILLVLVSHPSSPRSELKERVEEVGRRESALLEKNIGGLATIGSVSPLLGLLGTVIGMVMIFAQTTSGQGLASPEQLAAGISTALYTTVLGLIVAIPAILTSRYLHSKARMLAMDLEEESFRVLDTIAGGEA